VTHTYLVFGKDDTKFSIVAVACFFFLDRPVFCLMGFLTSSGLKDSFTGEDNISLIFMYVFIQKQLTLQNRCSIMIEQIKG
jgi:hypothetical protein